MNACNCVLQRLKIVSEKIHKEWVNVLKDDMDSIYDYKYTPFFILSYIFIEFPLFIKKLPWGIWVKKLDKIMLS